LRFHSQAFFQNNSEMARSLVGVVRNIFEKQGNNHYLLDLYGGVGTFGICLADLFREVTVVECVEPAIVVLRRMLSINNVLVMLGVLFLMLSRLIVLI
jgi:tRNA/tmRNA/rRNA uracil-C5-methylase (TrmA/RlmC/RlmD family)